MASYSVTITTGGTAQIAAAADVNRMALVIDNSSGEDIWYAFGSTAVADSPSFFLAAGSNVMYDPNWRELTTKALSVIAATTGTKITIFDTKG